MTANIYDGTSTPIPTALIDDRLAEMPKAALKCYLLIARRSWFHILGADEIPHDEFGLFTGLTPSAINKGLQWLEQRELIMVVHTRTTIFYRLGENSVVM